MCTIGTSSTGNTTQSRATLRGKNARAYSTGNHDKKIYIESRINNFRTVCLIDSGSDLSIIHNSLYKKIKPSSSGKILDK